MVDAEKVEADFLCVTDIGDTASQSTEVERESVQDDTRAVSKTEKRLLDDGYAQTSMQLPMYLIARVCSFFFFAQSCQ